MEMPIISKIQLFEQPEQPVLAIRRTIHFNDYPQIAGAAYEEIMAYAAQHAWLFAGGPYVCYHNSDLEKLDVEMGFPLAKPVPGKDEIRGYSLPASKVVSGIFLGAYEESDPLMLEIIRWIADHGYEQEGTIFNYYLNNEERPTGELLTRIAVPVR
jgi:effector-binding domain-containing protein